MVEYSNVNAKLTDTQLKKLKNAVKKWNWNYCENEFENVWWKWSASWIIIDNKIKNEAKKCI